MPVPEVSPVPGSPVYRHEPATRVSITRSPLTRDPYEARHVAGDSLDTCVYLESRHVYVAPSDTEGAGEGLWAKQGLRAGQLVALFNGVRQRHLYLESGVAPNLAWSGE